MGFSFSEPIIKKDVNREGSLGRCRGGSQNFDEYDRPTQKQMEDEGERNGQELLDKDDLPTKCATGNEKDILPQMRRVSLKKRSSKNLSQQGQLKRIFLSTKGVSRETCREEGKDASGGTSK